MVMSETIERPPTVPARPRQSCADLVTLAGEVLAAGAHAQQLTALSALRAAVEQDQQTAVSAARAAGMSWAQVASALGMKSRQAARQRFTPRPKPTPGSGTDDPSATSGRPGGPVGPRTANTSGTVAPSASPVTRTPGVFPRAPLSDAATGPGDRSVMTGSVRLGVFGSEVARLTLRLTRASRLRLSLPDARDGDFGEGTGSA